MDIDFIKWMCDKADGFSTEPRYYPDGIGTVYKEEHEQINELYKETTSWEILLQRAIEGVNRTDKTYTIAITERVCVFEYLPEDDGIWFKDAKSIDQAKESALMYIYEQEQL